jgi:hypothetical protein
VFKRIFSARILLIVGIGYGVLWLLTATLGTRQVRREILAGIRLDKSFVEIAPDYGGPMPDSAYSCRVTRYAPFVLAVKWSYFRGDFSTGASGVVLWFGRSIPLPPFHGWIT